MKRKLKLIFSISLLSSLVLVSTNTSNKYLTHAQVSQNQISLNKWNDIVSNLQIFQNSVLVLPNSKLNALQPIMIKGQWTNNQNLHKGDEITYKFINEKPINLHEVTGEVKDKFNNLVGHIKLDSLNSTIKIIFDTDYVDKNPHSSGSWFVSLALMNQSKTLPPYKLIFGKNQQYFVSGTLDLGGDATSKDGVFEIIKTTEDKTLPLGGAVYQVFDEKNNLVDQITTNSLGIAYSKPLIAGHYHIKEIIAPTGYQLDKVTHYIDVVAGISTNQMAQINLIDKVTKVKVVKAQFNSLKLLAGAHFRIEDSQHHTIIKDVVTNTYGEAIITKLPIGKYFLIETISPKGYVLNSNPIEFNVTNENGDITIKVFDKLNQISKPNELRKSNVNINQKETNANNLVRGSVTNYFNIWKFIWENSLF